MRVYFYKIAFAEGKAEPVFTARPKAFAHRTGAAFGVSGAEIDKIRRFCREYNDAVLVEEQEGDE